MRRPHPVTIVILQSGDRRRSRAFLGELARVTDPADNVFLAWPRVDDDATSLTREREERWRVKAKDGSFRRPDLVGGHTRPSPHPHVVIVDDRVTGSGRWIDRLVELVAQHDAVAVAPRSNLAIGDEALIGIPYRPYEPARRTAFLAAHDGSTRRPPTSADRLGGPCVATTLARLAGRAGFAELMRAPSMASLFAEWNRDPGDKLVAEDVYLHHPGGSSLTRDQRVGSSGLVSACLIVKNEAENLDRCLASIAGVVDEIVVYDTGSTDGTIELAERYSDKVVRGYWDDDFARARNAALEHCTGEWILWLDADEALVCSDADALRARLDGFASEIEGLIVLIDNLRGSEASTPLTHPACRLFRRGIGSWQGTLHEQIVAREGSQVMSLHDATGLGDLARIRHWGYLQAAMADRSKGERNLKTAFGDLAGRSELHVSDRVLSLGRSHQLAGNAESGIELCRLAVDLAVTGPTLRMALRGVVEGLTGRSRYDEALRYIEPLRQANAHQLSSYLAGLIYLAEKHYDQALESLQQIEPGLDVDGFEYSDAFTAGARAAALAGLGRQREAVEVLLGCLSSEGGIDAHLGVLLEAMEHEGLDLGVIFDAIGEERMIAFAPQLLQIQPEIADRCCEAWFAKAPQSKVILAVASKVAMRLSLERMVVWSTRLRSAGLEAACPLVKSAHAPSRHEADRAKAAEVALREFGDPRAELLVHALSLPRGELLGGAPPTALAARGAPEPSILVIARDAASTAALATALVLRRLGNDVTLLHPQPADESFALLNDQGIGVHAWSEPDGGDWERACLALVAIVYAARPVHHVLLMPGTEVLADRIRERLPLAAVQTESAHSLPVTAADLFRYEPAPLAGRRGIAVALNARGAEEAELQNFGSHVAPELMRALGTEPVILLGDDPKAELARALPLAMELGALADSMRFLKSVRLLLLPCSHDATQWLSLAALCGTPALVVPSDPAVAAALVRATGALLSSDEIWRSQVPPAPSQASGEVTPLAQSGTSQHHVVARPREVRIVGDVRSHASLARVNREMAFRLRERTGFRLTIESRRSLIDGSDTAERLAAANIKTAAPGTSAAVEIRHFWPPDFSPAPGRVVSILPWELGAYPAEWVGPIRDVVDEVWVPSTFVRQSAIEAGVDADKVVVIPNGVDCHTYRPDGVRHELATKRGTRFLFVGGLIDRKGVDVLLEVYLSTFSNADDVCLVVKPFGTGSVYDAELIEQTLRRAAEGGGPEIEIIDEDLSEEELAALYRSCTALVHPYRGEGFGLPIAEAMACGLPVVTPRGGASDDFCDESTGWVIDAFQTPVAVGTLTPTLGGFWWLEPSRIDLAKAMRAIAEDHDEARRRGLAGHERISEGFTWEVAAELASTRLLALLEQPVDGASTKDSGRDRGVRALSTTTVPSSRANDSGPRPRFSLIVCKPPDCSTTPSIDWAVGEVDRRTDVELIVVDETPPLGADNPAALVGDRVRVLHNVPIEGSERARQRGASLARGDILVLTDANVLVSTSILDALGACFDRAPNVGAVLVSGAVAPEADGISGLRPRRPQSSGLFAVSSTTLAAIGGHWMLSEGAPISSGEVSIVADDVLELIDAAGFEAAVIVDSTLSAPCSVRHWAADAHADQSARPSWTPVEVARSPRAGLNIVGLLDAACGIGDAGRRYVEAAEASGREIATFAFDLHGSQPLPYQHRGSGRAEFDTNLFVLNADVFGHFRALAEPEMTRDRYSILLPFWELEELSAVFSTLDLVDEVWAASEFLARAFQTTCTRPVTTMPLPVRRRDGTPRATRATLGLPEGFVFLTTFDFSSLALRKNCLGVVDAFCQAFVPGEGPILVVKTLNATKDPGGSRALRERSGRRRDIVLIDAYLDDDVMSDLVGSADCYVSLHRSEGFGLTLADSMAWGRPVIATNYSGNLDFMTPSNSYLVAFEWCPVPDSLHCIYPAGARWADPRIDAAATAMREVFLDQAEARRRGARAREDIRRTHSIEVVANELASRLDEIAARRTSDVATTASARGTSSASRREQRSTERV